MDPQLFEWIIRTLLTLYNWFTTLVRVMLLSTILHGHEELASEYANAISLLSSITAFYLLLTLFEGAKKVLKILLIIGWILLAIALAIGIISTKG